MNRGDRLNPPKSSRIYWVLSQLREAYQGIADKYLPVGGNATIVDYGCGNMPYRPVFERDGVNYVGCDLPGNELADLTLDQSGRTSLPDCGTAYVLSSQVLEHVGDPHAYLVEAYRILADDGLLLLSTHGVWKYHPDPQDFWRWTCDGLRKTLAEVGFEVVELRSILGPEATGLQIWQDAVLPRVPSRLQAMFTRYMQWKIRRADRRCSDVARNRDAGIYIVVARKALGG